MMYKLAVAILLLSAPAFAQDAKPDMPKTNMKNTVIPKSGGEQTPATTPTTAAQAPNAASTTQTTGESNPSPAKK
jgi:hypothetical protein